MRKLHISIACLSLCLAGCGNSGNDNNSAKTEQKTTPVPVVAPQSKLTDSGTKKLMTVVADYYQLKDAFVATSAAKADSSAGKLLASSNELRNFLKNDSANGKNLAPYLDTIVNETNNIIAIKENNCEKKRVPFGKISDMMFSMLKQADLKNAGVYREYCPMAFDEKGAYWLSNDPDIKNPYFGSKMLDCGDVEDSLK